MPLQRVPINNFRGGLNTRDGPFDLMPNESPDLLNVTLTSLVGQLQVRQGKSQVGTTAPGVIDHCRQAALANGARYLMCSINGAIYTCDAGGNFVLRFTGTTGTIWDFSQTPDASGNDRVWCMNGIDPPQKWDGQTTATAAWAGSPPNCNRILVWRNKMIGVGVTSTPSRLYLSKAGDPEATTGGYDFLDLRGDDFELGAIAELQVLADRLYAFKERSVWLVTDPTTFANRRLGEPGCGQRFQSDVIEDKLYFFNRQGLWSTAGVTVALETGSITNLFPQRLNVSALSKVRIVGTQDSYPRIILSLPVDSSATNNLVIELVPHINFRRIGGRRYLLLPAFMLHTFSATSLAAWKPTQNSNWGLYGGDPNGKLYQYFWGQTDDGTPVSAKWQSAWMAIQGEEPFERIRRVNVELSGDAVVDIFEDFEQAPAFSAALPNPPTPGGDPINWDAGIWDSAGQVWDPYPVYRFTRVRPESRARFHAIRFRTMPGGQPFLINVAEFAVRGGKEH
jgi:hypothetical protein